MMRSADHLVVAEPSRGRRAARLAVIGGLSSFGPLSLDLYLPALPRVAASLHASDGATQLSVSACLLGLAIGQFVFGPAGDRFGRRRPLLAGVTLWTLTALLCALTPSALVLAFLRLVQGFGGAAGLVLSRAVISDLYESEALGRAFAVVALLSNITPAIAPVAGGALLHIMSWRGVFITLAVTGVVLLAATWQYLPESLDEPERSRGGLRRTIGAAKVLSQDPLFAGPAATFVLASTMLFAYISMSSIVLQRQYGLSPGDFSAVFAANSIGIAATGYATVRLLRHRSPQRLLLTGLVAAVAGAAALTPAALAGGPLWILLVTLVWTISPVGVIFPTATSLAMLRHKDTAGTGSAILGGTQYLAGGLVGPVVSLAAESAAAMTVAMGLCSAGALAAYLVSRLNRHASP